MITVLQFLEELPDRQAADAVRGRIDWKYLLGLELTDSGFDATVLCEFRKRLIEGKAEQLLLDLQAARLRQQTPAFAQQYVLREGIEATISQGVRAFDMRRSRYIGEAKTHLRHIGIAVAINVVRVVAWLDGEPLAPTRVSAYERLYYAA